MDMMEIKDYHLNQKLKIHSDITTIKSGKIVIGHDLTLRPLNHNDLRHTYKNKLKQSSIQTSIETPDYRYSSNNRFVSTHKMFSEEAKQTEKTNSVITSQIQEGDIELKLETHTQNQQIMMERLNTFLEEQTQRRKQFQKSFYMFQETVFQELDQIKMMIGGFLDNGSQPGYSANGSNEMMAVEKKEHMAQDKTKGAPSNQSSFNFQNLQKSSSIQRQSTSKSNPIDLTQSDTTLTNSKSSNLVRTSRIDTILNSFNHHYLPTGLANHPVFNNRLNTLLRQNEIQPDELQNSHDSDRSRSRERLRQHSRKEHILQMVLTDKMSLEQAARELHTKQSTVQEWAMEKERQKHLMNRFLVD